MREFEWSEEAIEAATKAGSFRYLSVEEQATEFRAREAREVLDAAVRAQPVTALPACPVCGGNGERDDSTCDCFVPALEGAGQHAPGCACFKPCPSCKGSGVDRLIPESEIREWIKTSLGGFRPHDFPATAPMMLDDLARWLEECRD